MTITEKILAAHCGKDSVKPGEFVMVKVDLAMANDITAPLAIASLKTAGIKSVWDRSRVAFVLSHFVPAKDIASAIQVKTVREFAEKHKIAWFFDEGQGGIEHALLPDIGLILPGDVIIGADSHSCTYGALGAFSTGVGSTDLAAILAGGEWWCRVPESIKFVFKGKPGAWVMGKDLILYAIGKIGVDGATYKAMEFTGDAIRGLGMEDRLTMSNMAIEAGGKSGIIAADSVTEKYLASRTSKPYRMYQSDPDAGYSATYEWDISGIEPQVAKPNLPENVVGIREVKGTKINSVFIGSCTNGRLEDLRIAAKFLKGNKVARGVRLMVIPATQMIWKACLKEGLIDIFAEANATISASTCGPCLGGHMGVLGPGEVCLSTSNRNFPGRMGHRESQVYLANPAVAAASAVAGCLVDPRDVVSVR